MGLLYTKMKVFHYMDKIESLPKDIDTIKPPIHIRIKPTNVCGHNCWYCAYKADNLQLGKDMVGQDYIPKEKMMEIIDDVAEMGVQAVTLSGGGDPLCYPYILDAVRKLSRTSVRFALLTNGSRLQDEVSEMFAHNGTWLRVSIDGWDDESYSRYRNVKVGEFTKIMSNIEKFKKHGGKCYLGISLIVDRDNATHIHEIVGRLKDVGVDSVKVCPCIVSNEGSENNVYHQPIFEQVKESIQKAIEAFSNDNFEISDSYHTLDDKFNKTYDWCPYLQILPVIGADLNVYPCQDKAYNLEEGLIGSIKERRFRDFWFSCKEKFFRIDPSRVCNHHCVANEKNRLVQEYLHTDKNHLGFV